MPGWYTLNQDSADLVELGDRFWTIDDVGMSRVRANEGPLPATAELLASGLDEDAAARVRFGRAFRQLDDEAVERIAAAQQFPPTRRSGRVSQPIDWVTLTVLDNVMWNEPFWRADEACGGVQSFAEYCKYLTGQPPVPKLTADRVSVPLVSKACKALPCPQAWYPFTVQRCVTGNTYNHTAQQLDESGFGRLAAWAPREALRILYSGNLTNGALGNPYVVQSALDDPFVTDDADLTPLTGAVSINVALGMLSTALSEMQPDRAGLILVPQVVMDGHIDLGTIYQDPVGRWRTRSGHGIVGDAAFTGVGPGGVAPAAGEVWLWAIGSMDLVLGRPWSPQAMAAAADPQSLLRFGSSTTADRAYGVVNSSGIFQNALQAEYFVQGAVAFGGCGRFAIRAHL